MQNSTSHAFREARRRGAAGRFVEGLLAVGRVAFTQDELVAQTGLSPIAARNQLLRLDGLVRRVMPRQPFYLIVSPEHRAIGAPPPAWWLDDYFRWLNRPYYVALQSAAAEYGSAAQAIQVTQVITDRPHRDIEVGRLRLQFFVKGDIHSTPVQSPAQAQAPLNISTPEATALDLVAYANRLGGIERAAETLAPLLNAFTRTRLAEALKAGVATAHVQRFGFVLERLGGVRFADVVAQHLDKLRTNLVLLEPGQAAPSDRTPTVSSRWNVLANISVEIQP
ncbi:type IV toxin-antitoxin system AbiEi family antitoxin [Aromatoleum toluclasticum]|uniref:type IV toxin-antitoxin system AbiEi family antitoxin domain-containing protein n=1 Tax=Aromatoleum toluclasticum TaxID=92003 RepID=UPI001D1924A8|nr:type IV toxin-antitoxin system AbiEi family antitoxin [Aromatoleum toluclasticum]MCC4118587.1 type IV toxin-antitoxin system AbiEi family antitoxin [Aromatoleum toluclasticum]